MQRIHSIDVFRAITMVLMIWVNDFWSLKDIPEWLHHAKGDQDFLGFSDIIFPCFLFIVGMSIPYAIRNRIDKGEKYHQVLIHIVLRSAALLVMGLFTVNRDTLNPEATGINRQLFTLLMITGFFLIWNLYPKAVDWKKYLFLGLQVTGVLILAFLAFHFRGGEDGLQPMRTQWWGILGLIGWTYLYTAIIYLFARKSVLLLMGFWALFILINVAEHAGWFSLGFIPSNGSLQGFTFAGIAASLLLDNAATAEKQRKLPLYYLGIGVLMVILGLLLRHHFIISKIQATPTWVFLCNGIAFGFLALVYFLVDQKGRVHWFDVIKPAGTSTLTCYLVPYIYYTVAAYTFTLPLFLKTGALGLVKSFVYALIVVGITALLGKMKIKLKI